MNKRALAWILLIIPVLAIAYAVYRSTAEVIITEENGRQITYGEPQHGLILGLCIFAATCLMGAIWLMVDDWKRLGRDDSITTTKVSSKVATNYPH